MFFSADLRSSVEVVADNVTVFASSSETSVSEDLADDSVTSCSSLQVKTCVKEELAAGSKIGL